MGMEKDIKKFTIISVVIVGILVISLITFLIVKSSNNNKNEEFAKELAEVENLSKSASNPIGKSVNEIEEDDEMEVSELEEEEEIEDVGNEEEDVNEDKPTVSTVEDKKEEKKESNATNKKVEKQDNNETKQTNSDVKNEVKIDLEPPIKGEIIREFAKDSLVFSNTLQEWVTHNGVDIKADKTSVVKSASSGTVYAIKNDPRYGLTVIINHDNGYQTIYSNLLTAEFVVKGEKVKKGQTIGTVGSTAAFEISDESHLHFELLRNNEYLDPVIYINF